MEHRKLHMEIWKRHSFAESSVCLLCRLKLNENNYTVKKSLSSAPKGAKDTVTDLGMSGKMSYSTSPYNINENGFEAYCMVTIPVTKNLNSCSQKAFPIKLDN